MTIFLRTLLLLLFLQAVSVLSQESYMQWLNGDRHMLGVKIPILPIETQEKKPPHYYQKYLRARNSINDTFFFKNLSDQSLIINKIHVQDTSFYTYTRKTAPGKIGYIVYHTTLDAHTNGIVNHVVRFNVMTNFSPWVMCETNYILVGIFNANWIWDKQKEQMVFTEIIDTFVHRKLYCDAQKRPLEMGLVQVRTGVKMHKWTYWDTLGQSRDSFHQTSMFVYVKDDYNCSRFQLKALVKKDGVWQNAVYRPGGNQYQIMVDPSTDSVFLYNDSVYLKMHVRYHVGAENIHYYGVSVIRYTDDYLAYYWNMEGFQYASGQYAIVFKDDPEGPINLKDKQERLKALHPLLDFEILHDQVMVVSLPKQRYWVDSHYLNKLLKDNSIDYLSQMLHSPQYGYTFLRNTVTVRGIIMERAVASDSVLSAHGFELSTKYPELGWVELRYKAHVINSKFCQQFNSLGEQKLFEDRVPKFFAYIRPGFYDYNNYIKE